MKTRLWTLLVLAAALPASASDYSPSDIPFEPPSASVLMSQSSGSVSILVEDFSGTPFEKPIARLIPLPSGAVRPQVALPGDAARKRGIDIVAGNPVIVRGLTLVPVRISAMPGTPASKRGSGPVEFEIRYDRDPNKAGSGAALAHSRGFFQAINPLLPDNARSKTSAAEEGSYLIITSPGLVGSVEPMYQWKQEMGYQVSIVTTDVAGTRNDEIQAYIRTVYDEADVPPQYLLIVGDVEQVAGWDYHQSVSDLPYSLMDGDDFLPDLSVGRLSVQNSAQAATVISKIVEYERNPYRDQGDEWFSRALMVGADYSSATPVTVSRWCRDQLYDSDYTAVDSVYYPPHWSTGPPFIRESIDRGVSLVSYRGWAYGWRGWEPPSFTVDHIPSLDNGRMLPVVFSFVCLNGNFAEPECFGEAWIRAGTEENPKGAVGFIGNSENWSHTRYNDAAAIGAFTAFREEGVRELGQVLSASRYNILREFIEQFSYDPWGDESVEFYFYIYSLLGDPSMDIRSSAPTEILVSHPDSISFGSSVVEVDVATAAAKTGMEGLRVGLVQNEVLIGSAWTDENGMARILVSSEDQNSPMKVTVTGDGVLPYQESIPVYRDGPHLRVESVSVTGDDNADGVLNPGETAEIRLTLKNVGPDDVTNVTASLSALAGTVIDNSSVNFPDIPAGDKMDASQNFTLSVNRGAVDGLLAKFHVNAYAGGNLSVGGFDLTVEAPDIRHESHELVNADELAHGVQTALRVTVHNDGSVAAAGAEAILRTGTPELVEVIDSTVTLAGDLAPGGSTTLETFVVAATEDAGVGQAAVFTLVTTTAEGYTLSTSFSVSVGSADHTAPLGPDGYGYYGYDNSDTDYPDAAPLYDWITTSAAYGGAGTKLDIGDNEMVVVSLPFTFTYYGEDYSSLLVCDNGWASFDTTEYYDFYNWSMPSAYGNGALLAPFWDNLNPEKEQDGVLVGDGIYTWYDSANDLYVIEWSRIGNLRSQHENQVDYDDLQTFQIVLYDPAHYSTPTGDGIVRFQYKQVVNNDTDRMYSTVGIENETGDVGLQYTYANGYPVNAAPLSAGLAIEFTTTAPRYVPFTLSRFTAQADGKGLRLIWEPGDDRPRSSYRIYRSEAGGEYSLVQGGLLAGDRREFIDLTAPPERTWLYKIGSTDPVGRETVVGPFKYSGEKPRTIQFALRSSSPNPSRHGAALSFSLPSTADVKLRVYSVAGRLVRTLHDGPADAGVTTAEWNGRDDRGERVPSGVYFARIVTGDDEKSVKITLLK